MMSWAILLSKYPRSLLGDEWPLLVLSISERAGLVTEDELIRMTECDKVTTRTTLVSLQMDGMIEYGGNHIRLSEKGSQVLERLDLHHDVLEDVLDSCEFQGKDRDDFERILNMYRRSAFRSYQNSLCTLRTWRSIARELPGSEIERRRDSEAAIGGMRSLLFRDLRNWTAHYRPARSELQDIGDTARLLILDYDTNRKELYSHADNIQNIAMYYLRALSEPENETPTGEERWEHWSKLSPLLIEFNEYQQSWQPDQWFDKWVVELKLPKPRMYSIRDNYLKRITGVLRDGHGSAAGHHAYGDLLVTLPETWTPQNTGTGLSDTFLADIMDADNIYDLARRRSVTEEHLCTILETLRIACSRLLAGEVVSTGANELFTILKTETRRTKSKKKA